MTVEQIPSVNFLRPDAYVRLDDEGIIHLSFPVTPQDNWNTDCMRLVFHPGDEHYDVLKAWLEHYYEAYLQE